MSIVVRFSPTALTTDEYDQTVRQLTESGDFPADGLEFHVCFGSEGNLKVSEIWDSVEQLAAFDEKLMPVLVDAGIESFGEPEIFEVHNIIKR